MKGKRSIFHGLGIAALAAFLLPLMACVQEVGDIDRTQANAVSKEAFAGVWYYVKTVVDIPYSSGFTFQGETNFGNGSKIVFDVQEDKLIAYPVVETVKGSEAKYTKQQIRRYWDPNRRDEFVEVYVGSPVAIWPIKSHFDIKRDYNTATGEQTNVIVENTTDRPWYMRDYIRVDWAGEEVREAGFITGNADALPVHYVQDWESNGLNPDAAEFEEGYIGIVTKYFATPSVYGCWYYYPSPGDCAGAVIKVRHSFKHALPNDDFETRVFTNTEHMNKFGFFLSEHHDYDDWYGVTESGRDYKAQLWNLWKKSQSFEPVLGLDGKERSCSTSVDCEIGERCMADKWFEDGVCMVGTPIPYRQRGINPIIYHLSAGHPGIAPAVPEVDESGKLIGWSGGNVVVGEGAYKKVDPLVREAYEAADGWDDIFRDTVAWLYYHEETGLLTVQDRAQGTKACDVDADCTTGRTDILFEGKADTTPEVKVSCAKAEDCNSYGGDCFKLSGSSCDVAGNCVCGKTFLCGANSPCPYGMACSEGQCYEATETACSGASGCATGEPCVDGTCHSLAVDVFDNVKNPRAYTFILADSGKNGVTAVRTIDGVLPGDLSPSQGSVRFVNASPGTAVTFRAVESDPEFKAGETFSKKDLFTDVSFDDANDAGADGHFSIATDGQAHEYKKIDPIKWRRVEVLDGSGNVLADLTNVQIEAGKTYLFAFIGGDRVVKAVSSVTAGASNPTSGIRIIDGIKGREMVDVGLDSVRVAKDMTFGQVTAYTNPIKRGQNRIIVMANGAAGDVTCFHENDWGKCVGWAPALSDEAEARAAKIKTTLPDLFVLCEPIYTGDDCTKEQMGNKAEYNDCRYSTKLDDGTIVNPCKDLVAHPDMVKKIGDARYNQMYWVGEAQAASPLGYGPTAADPETGRSFWASAFIYGASLVTYGQYATDLIELVNGNVSANDMISGKYIRDALKAPGNHVDPIDTYTSLYEGLTLGTSTSGSAGYGSSDAFGSTDDEAGMAATNPLTSIAKVGATSMTELRTYAMNPKYKFRALTNSPLNPMSKTPLQIALDKLQGSYVEDILVNDEVKLAMSNGKLRPGDAITPEFADAVAPSNWLGGEAVRREQQRMALLTKSENCVYMPDFMDSALYGMSKEIGCSADDIASGKKTSVTDYLQAMTLIEDNRATTGVEELPSEYCLQGEALRYITMGRIYGGVLEHEVGHTMGLRHNFAGSNDIFNYFDEYYDAREKETVRCIDFQGCNFARGEECYYDCTTDDDCARTTACVNGTCTDLRTNSPMGQCMGEAQVAVGQKDCKVDPLAKAGSKVMTWEGGACVLRGYCGKSGDCAEGEVCSDKGFCQSTLDGVKPEAAFLTKCDSDDQCGGGICTDGDNDGQATCYSLTKAIVSRPYVTEEEQKNKRIEYQYSTIMDYGQKINSDVHGLGKFDRAAIKFGYGDLVEVYKDTSMVDEYTELGAPYFGEAPQKFSSFTRDSGTWAQTLYHPFFFLNNVITIEGNKAANRTTVPYQQVKLERNMHYDYNNEYYWNSYIEVPYDFCSDEYRGNGGCLYFDAGADAVEVTQHAMDMLTAYYMFDAFQRERYSFGWGRAGYSYYARIMDRWMNPLRLSGLYNALYANLFADLNFWDEFSRQPMEGEYFRLSSDMAYQYLQQLIASPAPGRYELDPDTNTYVNVSYDTTPLAKGDSGLVIPLGQGKFPYTTFDTSLGYYAYDHPLWAGAWWEKLAAMETLTDASVSFMSDYVGEQLDIGVSSAIGFVTAYPKELTNLFGGIVSEAWDEWAGVAVLQPTTGQLEYLPRSAFNPQAQSSMPVVQPSISNLSFKTLAAVVSLATLPAGFDPSMTDSMAVVLKGNESDYELAPGMQWKEFTDPFSYKTYLALVPRYDADRLAVAAKLIDTATALKKAWEGATTDEESMMYASRLKEVVEMLDVLRELNEQLGTIRY